MSIFGSIVSKIFGHGATAAAASSSGPASAGQPSPSPTPEVSPASFNNPAPSGGSPGASAPSPSTSASNGPTAGAQTVDVATVLDGLAGKSQQKLDWRHSIVDMLKLLGLDSSLQAREELAKELNYSGSTANSAAMNLWLHKQVMQKLAENGGQVPAELRS